MKIIFHTPFYLFAYRIQCVLNMQSTYWVYMYTICTYVYLRTNLCNTYYEQISPFFTYSDAHISLIFNILHADRHIEYSQVIMLEVVCLWNVTICTERKAVERYVVMLGITKSGAASQSCECVSEKKVVFARYKLSDLVCIDNETLQLFWI